MPLMRKNASEIRSARRELEASMMAIRWKAMAPPWRDMRRSQDVAETFPLDRARRSRWLAIRQQPHCGVSMRRRQQRDHQSHTRQEGQGRASWEAESMHVSQRWRWQSARR